MNPRLFNDTLDDTLEQIADHIDYRRDHGLAGDRTEALLQHLGGTLATLGDFTRWLLEQRIIVAQLGLEERPEDISEIDAEDCAGHGPH